MFLSGLDRLVSSRRLRDYPLMLIVGYGLLAVYTLATLHDGVDGFGRAPGSDFITFYAASELARLGDAAAAFDMARIAAAERAVAPVTGIYLWHYPPPFQLLVAPFAYAPYGVALAAWTAATMALFLGLMRRICDHRLTLAAALGFPAVFVNLMHGQNGALNAAILGFGLLWLDRRPWLAGAVLGLLVCKPHFAVLLPLLLLAQGRWKSIAAAALSAGAVCAAAYAAFGPEPWLAFFRDLPSASALVEQGSLPWSKIPSVFVTLLSMAAPAPVAYAVHGLVAASFTALTLYAWRRPGPQALKVALAVPAILAVSPYCFDYDLVLMAVPIALIAEQGRRRALPPGVTTSLAFAYFSPLVFGALAIGVHVQLMSLGVLALYAAAWRTLADARRDAPPVSDLLAPEPRLA